MSKTRTARDLLVVALQDLNDGEQAVIERIGGLAAGVSAGLADYIADERARAAKQSERLAAALGELEESATDAPNIWLRAELDDAERDYQTIVPGALRDIALVGAFRKAKQSERVSYETAVGLARACRMSTLADELERIRDEEAQADDALAALLAGLLTQIAE